MQNDLPTYMGQPTNRGEIKIEPTYPNEGFAVIKCGETSVQIGYTILHAFARTALPHHRPEGFGYTDKEWEGLRNALHSILCEAAEGGKA